MQITHTECGTVWDMYAIEWPPKIVFCTQCRVPLKLVGKDETSSYFSYRRIS